MGEEKLKKIKEILDEEIVGRRKTEENKGGVRKLWDLLLKNTMQMFLI